MHRCRAKVALLFLVVGTGCGKDTEKRAACEKAWGARLAALTEQQRLLDEATAGSADRMKAVEAAAKATEAKIVALTVADRDVLSYPDRVKGRIAAGKMRLASMTPLRAEAAEGPLAGKLKSIGYDLEIQGDYRAVAKTVAALYDQPKAIFVDRLEVNISDEYKKWATVRAQVRVYSPVTLPATSTATPPPPEAFVAATTPFVQEGCDSTDPAALQAEDVRARLAARAGEASSAAELKGREAANEARIALATDLVRRRDDNRAAFTTHADELVTKAKDAVTGFAELRLKADGEPDWR